MRYSGSDTKAGWEDKWPSLSGSLPTEMCFAGKLVEGAKRKGWGYRRLRRCMWLEAFLGGEGAWVGVGDEGSWIGSQKRERMMFMRNQIKADSARIWESKSRQARMCCVCRHLGLKAQAAVGPAAV